MMLCCRVVVVNSDILSLPPAVKPKGGSGTSSEAKKTAPAANTQAQEEPIDVPFDEVAGAYHRIRDDILRTSCERSYTLSRNLGMDIFVKR